MRVKPEPGTYEITISGNPYAVVVTTQGLTASFDIFGAVEWTWTWKEIEGGPILTGQNPYILSFTPPDIFHVIGPGGVTNGTYRKIT